MTDEELKRLAKAEATAGCAMDLAKKNNEFCLRNAQEIARVEARAKSAEHRVSELEAKVDIILDKLSSIGAGQDDSAEASEKIRKNTLRVFVTLIAAIIVNVINNFI